MTATQGTLPVRLRSGATRSGVRAAVLQICALFLLTGCVSGIGGSAPFFITREAQVTQVQACAIGYDLARQIHDRVSLRRTILLAPPRASGCEAHALTYLRQAGFRIAGTSQVGARFDITLSRYDPDTISAVASIGNELILTRSYRPSRTGVFALGPVSVQKLDPEMFVRRTGRTGS